MVDGFAEVVQQACALGKRHVDAELGCHQARDMRDLDGVVQNVLTIGRAVFLAAQELDDLDARRQDFVLNQIRSGQVLITCCEPERITNIGKRIFVEGGQIREEASCT